MLLSVPNIEHSRSLLRRRCQSGLHSPTTATEGGKGSDLSRPCSLRKEKALTGAATFGPGQRQTVESSRAVGRYVHMQNIAGRMGTR